MSIEWPDILKIAGSSSIFTALTGWALNHFFVHRANLRRDARYLAQRLAVVLEKFSIDCATVISDNKLMSDSGGAAGRNHSELPTLGPFPTDADWKALAPDLMDRVLSMPNVLVFAGQSIMFWWDVVGDEEQIISEADKQAAKVGLRAWALASELRKRCGVPESTLVDGSWDFIAVLKKQIEEEKDRDKRVYDE